MMLTIILVLLIILTIYLLSVERDRKRDHKEIVSQIESLQEELSSLRNDLNEIREDIEDIEDMSLTKFEREHRVFDNAQNLNISFFEKMEKGQIINLMSGSYYYPSEEIVIDRFQYKYDHIKKENKTEFGWEIHGFQKLSNGDEWTPCTFLADEHECQTSSCSGTIKKAL